MKNVHGYCYQCRRRFVRSEPDTPPNDPTKIPVTLCSRACWAEYQANSLEPHRCEATERASGTMAMMVRCESNAAACATWEIGLVHSMNLCRKHLQDVLDVCLPLNVSVHIDEIETTEDT